MILPPRALRAQLMAGALLTASCGSASGSSASGSAAASSAPAHASTAPALVQVENSSDARPQWGLQQADVVYEYVTEGGISRFSALYTRDDVARIGPVRSARLVTVHLARIYGAVIVYSGASSAVQSAIDGSGVPHVEESTAAGDLYRIPDRAAPHNLVTDGQHLEDLIAHHGASSATSSGLWSRTTGAAPPSAHQVARVAVPVSTTETPTFTFDAALNGWRRAEPDTGPFVDASSGKPVVVGTLIVQQVSIMATSDVEDVNGATGVDHVLTGKGSAQVFTAGREVDATWTQPDTGPPSFSLADGSTAPIAPGLVWICLVPTGSRASAG